MLSSPPYDPFPSRADKSHSSLPLASALCPVGEPVPLGWMKPMTDDLCVSDRAIGNRQGFLFLPVTVDSSSSLSRPSSLASCLQIGVAGASGSLFWFGYEEIVFLLQLRVVNLFLSTPLSSHCRLVTLHSLCAALERGF